jgi:hypothetical protein
VNCNCWSLRQPSRILDKARSSDNRHLLGAFSNVCKIIPERAFLINELEEIGFCGQILQSLRRPEKFGVLGELNVQHL